MDRRKLIPSNQWCSKNSKTRINPAKCVDKRTAGYKRRVLSQTKATTVILELLKAAKTARIPADYVLFDSWFTSLSSLHAVKKLGYDVIGMVKKTEKMYFMFQGKSVSLPQIYKNSHKRGGRSRYLLSVSVDVVKDGETIPAKVVYVRNKSNRKDYLCLITTNTELSEEEIIRIYGKCWKRKGSSRRMVRTNIIMVCRLLLWQSCCLWFL